MSKLLESVLRGMEFLDVRGDLATVVSGLSYDSRKVREGDLFVAIRGTRQDGAQFIHDAIDRGAGVVVAEDVLENGAPVTSVRVENSRRALARISANFFDHPSREFDLIGVTGTNGKTTTTLLLEGILKQGGFSVGVIGTLAYRWAGKHLAAPMTTPESLDLQKLLSEMRSDGVSHVVMEVSSHALALGRVEGCIFRAGLFTNLSQDHLDFHHGMEDYFAAKASLFRDYLPVPENSATAAVINMDDPHGMRLIEERNGTAWSYSAVSKNARVFVKAADLKPSGIQAELSTPKGPLKIQSKLLGRLNLYNLLAAATTALSLGIPKDVISSGIAAVSSVDGRLQRVAVPPELGFEVVVDYAHTPDAMEKSIGCLREMTRRRLLVVFGCGGDRDRGKRPLMGSVAARLADIVIITSDNPRTEIPEEVVRQIEPGVKESGIPWLEPDPLVHPESGYTIEVDRKKAIELALEWAGNGDTVFIGGKGHETYQIVGSEVFHFDDREVVLSHYARLHP